VTATDIVAAVASTLLIAAFAVTAARRTPPAVINGHRLNRTARFRWRAGLKPFHRCPHDRHRWRVRYTDTHPYQPRSRICLDCGARASLPDDHHLAI
jgi:hypothetical protein